MNTCQKYLDRTRKLYIGVAAISYATYLTLLLTIIPDRQAYDYALLTFNISEVFSEQHWLASVLLYLGGAFTGVYASTYLFNWDSILQQDDTNTPPSVIYLPYPGYPQPSE